MTLDRFRSLGREQLRGTLLALWLDGRGEWEDAHVIAQDMDDAESAWIHAYLHRKEGDMTNARCCYRRAGRSVPDLTLEEEWEEIVTELAARG